MTVVSACDLVSDFSRCAQKMFSFLFDVLTILPTAVHRDERNLFFGIGCPRRYRKLLCKSHNFNLRTRRYAKLVLPANAIFDLLGTVNTKILLVESFN